MTTFVAVSVLMTILAGALLSKAMAETPFSYLDCVSYNTPSDRAIKTCESVIRGGGSLSGSEMDDLARYICIRTIPCTLGVSLSSIPECKLPEASTPDQDKACLKAFLGKDLTPDNVYRSDKFSNCEQDVGRACDRYSDFRTYATLRDVQVDLTSAKWTLTTFRNNTERVLSEHTGSLAGISTQMTQQENDAQLMAQRLEAMEKSFLFQLFSGSATVFYVLVGSACLTVVACFTILVYCTCGRCFNKSTAPAPVAQQTPRGMTDEERHEIIVHLYDQLRSQFTAMQTETPMPAPTDAEPVRARRPVTRRVAASVKRSRGL
jgi:hypothetical protein